MTPNCPYGAYETAIHIILHCPHLAASTGPQTEPFAHDGTSHCSHHKMDRTARVKYTVTRESSVTRILVQQKIIPNQLLILVKLNVVAMKGWSGGVLTLRHGGCMRITCIVHYAHNLFTGWDKFFQDQNILWLQVVDYVWASWGCAMPWAAWTYFSVHEPSWASVYKMW